MHILLIKRLRNALIIVLMFVAVALTVSGQSKSILSSKIGIVNSMPDGDICLAIKNKFLKARQVITVIHADTPQFARYGNIVKKLESNCSSDIEPIKNASYYKLKISMEQPFAEIGIVGRKTSRKSRLSVSVDIDGDGKREFFRSCTGMEGINFTVWNRRPLSGRPIWRSYYYLGYDTVPTCKRADSRHLL